MNFSNYSDNELLDMTNELINRGYELGWHKPVKYTGYIYIMVNPDFAHLVKIGWADDLAGRVYQLSHRTAVPSPYHVYASYQTKAERLVDKEVHNLIDSLNPTLRHSDSKEFYEMTPEQAYEILYAIAKINGDEDMLVKNPLNDDYFSNESSIASKEVIIPKVSNSTFWSTFNKLLSTTEHTIKTKTDIGNYQESAMPLAVGKANMWVGIVADNKQVYLDFTYGLKDKTAMKIFNKIKNKSDKVENDLGFSINWDEKRAKYSYNYTKNNITEDVILDIIEKASKMQSVFTDYVKQYR